jgi:hypothetical protein
MKIERRRKRIEDVRAPAVNGLPDDVYHVLHHSFVDIVRMRRSIESADTHVDRSREAISESWEVLKRLPRPANASMCKICR